VDSTCSSACAPAMRRRAAVSGCAAPAGAAGCQLAAALYWVDLIQSTRRSPRGHRVRIHSFAST
jgi:hypothetical protein